MPSSDVVVVGAGPAGSASAMLLARAGFTVTLLDQRTFPRAKPCGDCLSPGANEILRRFGVWDDILAAGPALLRGWTLTAGETARFTSTFEMDARSVAMSRDRLDAILLEAARAAGVNVFMDVRVTDLLRTADGRVTGVQARRGDEIFNLNATLTIGADGLRSRVARRLHAHARQPRLRKVSFTAHLRGVPDVQDFGEMHVRERACLGIAPVNAAQDLCNVTVVLPSAATHSGGARARMRAALRWFPDRDLSGCLRDDAEVLASGPFDWPTRRIVFDGAALVGDAAGYYDPFTGQGIFQALAGAELLAEESVTYLEKRRLDALRSYEERLRVLISPARRLQHVIEHVCARPAVARTVFRRLSRAQPLAERLIAVIGDLRPARDLLSPSLIARLIL